MSTHPLAPDLIPNLPVLHPVRLGVSAGCTHCAVFGTGWPVAVLDPCRRFRRRRAAAFHVHCDRRLGAKSATELHELVGPEIARFRFVFPGKIAPRRALVTRANAPPP